MGERRRKSRREVCVGRLSVVEWRDRYRERAQGERMGRDKVSEWLQASRVKLLRVGGSIELSSLNSRSINISCYSTLFCSSNRPQSLLLPSRLLLLSHHHIPSTDRSSLPLLNIQLAVVLTRTLPTRPGTLRQRQTFSSLRSGRPFCLLVWWCFWW